MIQYWKRDGTFGVTDEDNGSITIEIKNHSFTIVKQIYGYDEYDFWYDNIEDIVELRIK